MSTVYQEVTDSIIKQLENGATPWIKPWHTDSTADKNFITQAPYKGINRLMLGLSSMVHGFGCPVWATFKQWNDLGCRVRADEKGTKIIKYGTYQKTGVDKQKKEIEFTSAYLTTFYVFNANQVDGVTIQAPTVPDKPFNAIQAAEERIKLTGAVITHGGDSAFYAPSVDKINVPHKSSFISEASYYATVFHELTHWTGAEHRENRAFGKRFGDNAYAFEELVAEMGAAFLCQDYRIAGELRHAGYIGNWLKVLKEDSRAIFKAAALAQKSADYINGLNIENAELVPLPLAA
jgi:antirestriction protein ArdC